MVQVLRLNDSKKIELLTLEPPGFAISGRAG